MRSLSGATMLATVGLGTSRQALRNCSQKVVLTFTSSGAKKAWKYKDDTIRLMKVHTVKSLPFPGTSFKEVYPPARKLFNKIKGQTKRRPYVKSAYFKGEKVFIELFWVHTNQKNRKDRNKRFKYYACGIELLRNSRQLPSTKNNPNKSSEKLHRFAGVTKAGDLFYIQVKEDTRKGRKDLMSIFPAQ